MRIPVAGRAFFFAVMNCIVRAVLNAAAAAYTVLCERWFPFCYGYVLHRAEFCAESAAGTVVVHCYFVCNTCACWIFKILFVMGGHDFMEKRIFLHKISFIFYFVYFCFDLLLLRFAVTLLIFHVGKCYAVFCHFDFIDVIEFAAVF